MQSRSKALVQYALVAAAAVAAASVWSHARPEQGMLLDAETWQDVASAEAGEWPQDAWYRLVPREGGIDVRAVKPGDRSGMADDALFFRLPGTALQEGLRRNQAVFQLRVQDVDAGLQVAIHYGQATYTYLLGPAGTQSSVRAVADLDGDRQPDFVVDTDDATFLLLSTQARPGPNLPTAEMSGPGC
ncbi:MAG TPA: hypothetical protein VHL79_11885 [Ramlibacter sp.]|nr:hypothetical protein [Ramlibacter sp.]